MPAAPSDAASGSTASPLRGPAGRAYVMLLVVTFCWASNTIFARLAVGEVSPLLLVALRWSLTLAVLAVIALPAIRQDWPVLRGHLVLLLSLGALGFTAFNALYYVAAHTTTALNLGILQGIMPALVLIGVAAIYRVPVRGTQALGVVVTLIGVALVVSSGSWEVLRTLAFQRGDALVLLAIVLYAGYTIWLRQRPPVGALSQFSLMACGAFLASLPLAAYEILSGDAQMPTPTGWWLLAGIVLLPTMTSQLLFIRGVAAIGPERAAIFVNLVPILAPLLAVTLLGETFAWYHGAGLAFVLFGIYLSERSGS